MRRLLLCVTLCFSFCFAFSQAPVAKLTANSVVKDSAGVQYKLEQWQELVKRDYTLKAVEPENEHSEFVLVKLSEKQVAERQARRKEMMESMPKPKESLYFKTGERPLSFAATDMEGNKVNLKKSAGKIVVLNFWFINCGPCRTEIPELNALVDSFQASGKVLFYGVALDDKKSLNQFLSKTPFKYAIIDDGRYISSQYGVRSYPTHVVIDTDGKVYFHTTGLGQNTIHWIRKSIEELLARGGIEETKTGK
ncbi:MAG TPA: TlpA disulfide reductase family protein [Flavisolibacter sp.]|nr:TlpA disulfide reductase family protein [Flavisolibacter sp.]